MAKPAPPRTANFRPYRGCHRREACRQPQWRRGFTYLLLTMLVLAGCRGRGGRDLRPDARLSLPANATATGLAVQGERLWLTAPGLVQPGDTLGRFAGRSAALPGDAEPKVLGAVQGRVYVRLDRQLLAFDARTGRVVAERAGMGANRTVLDPLGRFLFVATPSGAVLGLQPETLETAWAWPRIGQRITAAAMSPEGDRLYIAVVAGDEGRADLLARDAQTGRVVGEQSLPWPLHEMESTGDGLLIGIGGAEGERDVLVVLRPGRGTAEVLWRRRAGSLGLDPPLRLRVDPTARRLAVFGAGEQGMRLLNARTGRTIGTVQPAPADAAFGGAGVLYTVAAGELRVYR